MRITKILMGVGFVLFFLFLAIGPATADKPTEEGVDSGAFKGSNDISPLLPDGGGEPGKAYMALVDAIYKKDYGQICNLNDIDEKTCQENTKGIDGLIAFFSAPKAHKVTGGSAKGTSAAIDISYIWANESVSKAIVTMERNKNGKWIFKGMSAHAEKDIEVKADATRTLGADQAPRKFQ